MTREEFIKLWLEALRSGEYKQARDKLRLETKKGFSYCCLGVACDLAEKNGIMKHAFNENELLPAKSAKFIGIENSGEFSETISWRGRNITSLASANDKGISFKSIAKIIEQELEKGNFEKP